MGLVMSFSSLVGFLIDLVFPGVIKSITVRRMLFFAGGSAVLFCFTMLTSLNMPFIWIFLIAMIIWGFYYEIFGFAEHQFIADSIPLKLRTAGWAVFGVFKNLAYFLGPLVAAMVGLKGESLPLIFAGIFIVLGIGLLTTFHRHHDRKIEINLKEVNIFSEIGHWRVLFKYVWPVVIMSLVLGLIDSTFWTTGTVLTEKLTDKHVAGSLFLSFYQLPALFIGIIMARFRIFEGKKMLAIKFLLFSGLVLSLLGFIDSIWLILVAVLLSSTLLSVCYPLVNAIYTDILTRMGMERKHLVGLSSSSISLAYILGPTLAGFITNLVGDKMTFTVMGILTVVVSVVLILTIPKKIRLPETEIQTWV